MRDGERGRLRERERERVERGEGVGGGGPRHDPLTAPHKGRGEESERA